MLWSVWYSGRGDRSSSSCWSLPSELPVLLELCRSEAAGLKPDVVDMVEERSTMDESESESIVTGLECVVWDCGCWSELVLSVFCCGGALGRAASVALPSLGSPERERCSGLSASGGHDDGADHTLVGSKLRWRESVLLLGVGMGQRVYVECTQNRRE